MNKSKSSSDNVIHVSNPDVNNTKENEKFQWRNRTQHLMFFIIYILDWDLFSFLQYEHPEVNPKYVPSLFHYFIVTVFIGEPILFFQTFVGEYTRRGCVFIGEMVPIFYGLGYSMLLFSFVKFTFTLFYTLKIFGFFCSVVLQREQTWMMCTKMYYVISSGCIKKEDIDKCPSKAESSEPCFTPSTRQFAAFFYKEYELFFRSNPVVKISLRKKLFYHFLHLIFLLPLLFIFALKGIRGFAVSLKATMILSSGGMLSVLVMVITRPGCLTGFRTIIQEISVASLCDWRTWVTAIKRSFLALRLGEGGHFLLGSFIPELITDHHRSMYLTVAFFSAIVFTSVYYHLLSGLISFKLNMEMNQLDLDKEEHTVFVTYPTVLGKESSPYFFSLIHILVMFLISFHSLVLEMLIMQKTIKLQFDLMHYSRYIKFILLILASFSIAGLEFAPYYKVIQVIKDEFIYILVCTVGAQLLVLFIYGFQRISDDVQFLRHTEVKTFTKLRWLGSLLICIITDVSLSRKWKNQTELIIKLCVFTVLCLPVVAFTFITLFSYMKKKNVIGLFKPSDLFGPPDAQKRILRILYNPRLTINGKGREVVCDQNCLLKSNVLQTAVQEEIDLIKRFIADLNADPPDLILVNDITSHFKAHEKNLLKELEKK